MSEGIQNITDILKLCWAPTNDNQYNYENDSEESATSHTLVKTLTNPDIENKIIRDVKNDKENSLNSKEYNFNQDLTLNDLEGIPALEKSGIGKSAMNGGVSDELIDGRNGSMPELTTEYTCKENVVEPCKDVDIDRIREPLTGQTESEQLVHDKEQPPEHTSSKDPAKSHHYQLRDKSCPAYNHSMRTYQWNKKGDLGEDLVYSSTTPDYHDPDWRYANTKKFKIKKKVRRKKKKIVRKKHFSEPINISYNLRTRELCENSSCLENTQLSLYYTDCQQLKRNEGRNINHVSNCFKRSEKYTNCKASTSHSEGKKRNSYTLRQDTTTKRICLKAIQDPINVQPIPIITLKTSKNQKEKKSNERTLKVKKMLLGVGSTLNQIEAALTDWNFGSRIPSTNEASYLLQQIQEINRSLKEEYDIICNTAIQGVETGTFRFADDIVVIAPAEDVGRIMISGLDQILSEKYSTNSVYTEALLPLLKKLNIEKEEEMRRGSKYNFIIRKPSLLVNDLTLKTSSSRFSEKISVDKLSIEPLCNNSTLQKQGNGIIGSYLGLEGNDPKEHLTKKHGTTEDSKKEGLNSINEDLSTNDLPCKIIEKEVVGPGNDFNSELKKGKNVCLPKNVVLNSEDGLTHQEQQSNLPKDKSEGLPLTEVSNQITSNRHSNARPSKNFKKYKKSAVKISLVNSTSPSVLKALPDEKSEFLPEGKNMLRECLAADIFGRSSEIETTGSKRLPSTAKDNGTIMHGSMPNILENPRCLIENNVSIPSHGIKEKNDLLCNVETKSKAFTGFSDENHISSSPMTNNTPSEENSNEYIFGAIRTKELSSFNQINKINEVEENLVTRHDSIQPSIVALEVHHTASKTYSCVPLARRSGMCGKATISSKTGIVQTHSIAASTDVKLKENCVQKDLENHHASTSTTNRNNNEHGCNDPLDTSTVNTTDEVNNITPNQADVSYKHRIAAKNKVLPSNAKSTQHGCNGPLNTSTLNITDDVNKTSPKKDVPASYKHHIAAKNKVLPPNANSAWHGSNGPLNTSSLNITDRVNKTTSNTDVPTSYKHHIGAKTKEITSSRTHFIPLCSNAALNNSRVNITVKVATTTPSGVCAAAPDEFRMAAPNTAKDKTLFSIDTTHSSMAEGLDFFIGHSGSSIRSNVDKLNSAGQTDINYNLNPSLFEKSKNSNMNIKYGTTDTSVNKAHHSSDDVKERHVNVDITNNINYQGASIYQRKSNTDTRLVNVGDGIIGAKVCSDNISKYKNMETMPDPTNHQCKEASSLKKHNDFSKNYNNKCCGLLSSNEYITMNQLSHIEDKVNKAFDIPEDNTWNTEQFLNNSLDIDFSETFVIGNKIDENSELILVETDCPLESRTTIITGCNPAVPTFLEEISNAAFSHDESEVEDPKQYYREVDSLHTVGYISKHNNFVESKLNFADGKEKGNNESHTKLDNPGPNTYSAHDVEVAADANLTIHTSKIQDNLFDKTNCNNQPSDHVPESSNSKEKPVFPIENIRYLRLKSSLEFLPIDDFSDLNSQSIFSW